MPKKVYLEPPWVMHPVHHRMIAFPPPGYEFVIAETPQEKLFNIATRWDLPRFLLRSSDGVIPTGLVKSWLERKNKPPSGTVLTFACDHLVLRREPWVIEVEYASFVLGKHPKHLRRFKGVMERALASPYCRKILCPFEASRRSLLSGDLDSRGFQHKVEVLYHSMPPRSFVKEYGSGKVKLIFLGAQAMKSTWEQFVGKGGREVLETYAQLRQRFSNLELLVRANVPPDVKARYGGVDGLRIVDEYIPQAELEREYQSADILLLPSYGTSPFTLLDAMSYELPVVTIDSWANAEYVEDGKTGLVAPNSKKVPYYYPGTSQVNFGTAQYQQAIRATDPQVVEGLAQRVGLLIENPELRRQMGKAGRWEVEHGKFSLAKMNEKLARIFDEAIAADG